ncbi:MAG: hypothetical protein JWM26_267 [Betaproteobacteria bacterium]|nr:hypothetical protein [Betaproteobacteria bacterium]
MVSTRLISSVVLLAFSTAGAAATSPAKPEAKPAAKTAAKAAPGPKKLRGKMETLACRLGTEDRHARIAVVTIGGTVDSFAYYSKWKPRTCSVYLQRNRDMYSKWADTGAITTVNIEKGAFLIENKKGEYHFIFRDVDRERYCGMDGVINGSLTIRKGSEACVLDGEIMVEGTPLGQAFVNREEDKPPPGLLPGVPSSTEETAAAPEASSAAQAKPAAVATPATAATATPATAATAKPEAKAAPAATAATAEAQPAQKSAAPADANPAAAEKSAESESGGVRSFFRALGERPGPAGGRTE